MKYSFISGIPASGKSYLAQKVSKQTNSLYVNLDKFRIEMRNDPRLEPWASFFWNQDEGAYWKDVSCKKHCENLKCQSEAMWPYILDKISEIKNQYTPTIFECVNILPHLAHKDLDFRGVYLLGESLQVILERLKAVPRWGKTEFLQKKEAEYFFLCEGEMYKEEANRYGYKSFSDNSEAEQELLALMN